MKLEKPTYGLKSKPSEPTKETSEGFNLVVCVVLRRVVSAGALLKSTPPPRQTHQGKLKLLSRHQRKMNGAGENTHTHTHTHTHNDCIYRPLGLT